MTDLLNTFIPGKPVPQGKLVAGRFVKAHYPKHVTDYRAYVVGMIQQVWGRPAISDPVAVSVTYSMPRPKSHYRTGRKSHLLRDGAGILHTQTPDVDKLLRLTFDALALAGVIVDDKQVVQVSAMKVWEPPPGGQLVVVSNALVVES